MLSSTFSLPESGAYAEDKPRLSTWLQRRKHECSVECSLSIPHYQFICLNHTNFHDDYITTGLKNLLWFSFFHPFSKNRQIRRWTGTAAHLEPQNPRNRVLQQAGCLDRGTRVRWVQVKDPAPVYGHTQMHTTRKFKKPNRSIGIGLLSDLHRSLSTLN